MKWVNREERRTGKEVSLGSAPSPSRRVYGRASFAGSQEPQSEDYSGTSPSFDTGRSERRGPRFLLDGPQFTSRTLQADGGFQNSVYHQTRSDSTHKSEEIFSIVSSYKRSRRTWNHTLTGRFLSRHHAESVPVSSHASVQRTLSPCHVRNTDGQWQAKMSQTVQILAPADLMFPSRWIETRVSVRRW